MAAHHPRHDSRVRLLQTIWPLSPHPFCSAVISGHTGCKTQGDQLAVTGVFDPFMVQVQIAFFTGQIATSPVWLYQLWAFIAPGLYAREKRWTYLFVGQRSRCSRAARPLPAW